MGKKRIAKKGGAGADAGLKARALSRVPKKKIDTGILHIQATYNNTRVHLTDRHGNSVTASSSGALGFKGARKGTPYAAAKAGEVVGEQAATIGVKSARVIIKGVGAGRDSALRAFAGKGIEVDSISDATPVAHNGPRAPKPRRV